MIMQNWSKKLFGIIIPLESIEAEQIRFDNVNEPLRINDGSDRSNNLNLRLHQVSSAACCCRRAGGAPPGIS